MEYYKMQSDQELLGLIAKNSDAAFAKIYDRYWEIVYRAAYNVLKDEDSCMDAVQDVFTWLWNHRADLEIASLKSYLVTAVRFKVLNMIKQDKVRNEILNSFDNTEIGIPFTDIAFEIKELRAIIDQFAAKLPEQARIIFQLSRNEQLSNKEIAEKMGISEKTVKNQLYISRKKLRSSLGRMSIWMYFFL